ncbi:MAG: hypothetical protein H6Q08_2717, partial [Acidobacteria bacterium]|nr:hypothetical protein [Acidobacteriota bacterium]
PADYDGEQRGRRAGRSYERPVGVAADGPR